MDASASTRFCKQERLSRSEQPSRGELQGRLPFERYLISCRACAKAGWHELLQSEELCGSAWHILQLSVHRCSCGSCAAPSCRQHLAQDALRSMRDLQQHRQASNAVVAQEHHISCASCCVRHGVGDRNAHVGCSQCWGVVDAVTHLHSACGLSCQSFHKLLSCALTHETLLPSLVGSRDAVVWLASWLSLAALKLCQVATC